MVSISKGGPVDDCTGWTFAQLLDWHLTEGTRPGKMGATRGVVCFPNIGRSYVRPSRGSISTSAGRDGYSGYPKGLDTSFGLTRSCWESPPVAPRGLNIPFGLTRHWINADFAHEVGCSERKFGKNPLAYKWSIGDRRQRPKQSPN
jgi:hypothetical protein